MVKKFLSVVKLYLITGKKSQTFLDAQWIKFMLRNTPKKYKKTVAMNVLALSPHYFLYSEEKKRRPFLIGEYKRNYGSRLLLFRHLLSKHISPDLVVMDYGSGPGFLARIVAQRAKKVYGIDISDGVLLCADAINHSDNLTYLNVLKNQTDSIPDNSIDLIYSFAVLQHVSADRVDDIFSLFHKKLKDNGKVLVQVQLKADGWKTEEEWKGDASVAGKLKYQYGLHAFSNSVSFYQEKLKNNGLKFISLTEMKDILPSAFDDIYYQQLIIGTK